VISKLKGIITNFSYTFSSNLVALFIATLVVAIVPKMLGIEDYGYFQIYLFYSGFVGFLQFGWIDGIYLRYGGKKYEDLDKNLFYSQFWLLTGFQALLTCLFWFYAQLAQPIADNSYILVLIGICTLLNNTQGMLLYVLQATFRIREYSIVIIIGRIFYCSLIIGCTIFQVKDYKYMIYADLIGRGISFFLATYYCKDIVFRNIRRFRFSISETWKNISGGIKLMFANIANMLIVGTVRWGIVDKWDVATFGKISLTLSVSNLIMTFISAAGIIMFPILRRTKEENFPNIYLLLRNLMTAPLYCILILYYPIKGVLSLWLPQYAESLNYMALLFPMCVYTAKTTLLGNSYLYTLRKENVLMNINFITFALSVTMTYMTVYILNDLNLAVISIVVLLAIRSILPEMYLARLMKLDVVKDNIYETILTIVFIISGWVIGSWKGMFIYTATYIIYILLIRKNISQTIVQLKSYLILKS